MVTVEDKRDGVDLFPETPKLTPECIEEILGEPNGPFILLELCREGRITPEEASIAIDRVRNTPAERFKRAFVALIETLFGR